jgi:MFS family permease
LATAGTLLLLTVPTIPALYAGSCVICAAAGLFYSANWVLGTELVPPWEAASYLGLSNLAGAGAIGAYSSGPIAGRVGYVLLRAVYGLLFLLVAVTLLSIKEPRGRLEPGNSGGRWRYILYPYSHSGNRG